jgi:UDP-2,3-diacylglucosamine pyrophosphatase LpxH
MKYKTIILSDIHLGSKSSRANDVIEFLENNTTETLILNGDIVDGWALKRGGKWKESHTKVLRKIMKMSEKGVNVIWLRGNHDEFLKDFIPFQLSNLTITEDYTFTSIDGRKMYVFHGDVLDVFITKAKWLAHIGSIGYDLALWMNRVYNKYREMRGLPYYSISKDIKSGVNQKETAAFKLLKMQTVIFWQHYNDVSAHSITCCVKKICSSTNTCMFVTPFRNLHVSAIL